MPKMTARPRARRRALEGAELLKADAELAGSPVSWHSPPCHPAERAEVRRQALRWVTHREALIAHNPDAGRWWRSIEAGTDPAFEADPRLPEDDLADQLRHHAEVIAWSREALEPDRGAA